MAVVNSFDVSDLKSVSALLAQLGPKALDHLEGAGIEGGLLLEREVKDRTPVGVSGAGGLRGSIHSKTVRLGTEQAQTEIGTPLPYALPVELGSKPHFPPLQPLIDWVMYKLGKGPDEAEGIAFSIALKISHHGTEGQYMFTDTFNENISQVENIYVRHADLALASIGGAQ